MGDARRAECEAVLDDCLAALCAAEGELTSALAGADLSTAVELAARVEQLGRTLYRLQVRVAGAVESESPAARGAGARVEAPYRRGCDLLRSRLRISGHEARRRVRAAAVLLPRTTVTGQPLAPLAAQVAHSWGVPAPGPESAAGVAVDSETVGGEGAGEGSPVAEAPVSEAPGPELLAVTLSILDEAVQLGTGAALLDQVEGTLVEFAATFDPETLRRVGQRLLSHLDPDGEAPSERMARSRQGVRVGATWRGLTHLDIWADAVQAEVLLTVLDTGSNPRRTSRTGAEPVVPVTTDLSADAVGAPAPAPGALDTTATTGEPATPTDRTVARAGVAGPAAPADSTVARASVAGPATFSDAPVALNLPGLHDAGSRPRTAATSDAWASVGARAETCALGDDRSRGQRMLDALVAACQAALRTATLPEVGGLPPQLLVTLSLEDLRGGPAASATSSAPGSVHRARGGGSAHSGSSLSGSPLSGSSRLAGSGRLPHAGPVPVRLLRRLACDADVIPIVLGTDGHVLDVGRTRRLVPPPLRRALVARDGGCLFPGCAVPVTWTEGHHVLEWARGGDTSESNTVLLCPFHHHAVHSGRWVVTERRADAAPGSVLGVRSPFVITSPWSARPRQTWNASAVGA